MLAVLFMRQLTQQGLFATAPSMRQQLFCGGIALRDTIVERRARSQRLTYATECKQDGVRSIPACSRLPTAAVEAFICVQKYLLAGQDALVCTTALIVPSDTHGGV